MLWYSRRCIRLDAVGEEGVFLDDRADVSTDFRSADPLEGQVRNGKELGRPWDVTAKA